jgi:hypothetical protein
MTDDQANQQAGPDEPELISATEPVHPSARDRITAALQLARQRVTAPDLGEKDAKRAKLDELIVRMNIGPGSGPDYERPTADELRDALGDPDEADIRHALDEWDVG